MEEVSFAFRETAEASDGPSLRPTAGDRTSGPDRDPGPGVTVPTRGGWPE